MRRAGPSLRRSGSQLALGCRALLTPHSTAPGTNPHVEASGSVLSTMARQSDRCSRSMRTVSSPATSAIARAPRDLCKGLGVIRSATALHHDEIRVVPTKLTLNKDHLELGSPIGSPEQGAEQGDSGKIE